MKVQVIHSKSPRIKNAPPDGFDARMEPDRTLLGGKLFWHTAQLACATKKTCDVIVLPCNLRYLSLIPAILRAKANGVGVTLWGHHFSKSKGSIINRIRNQVVFRLADSVVCYSFDVGQKLRNIPHLSDKTFVAPNSIDQESIRNAKAVWQEGNKLKEFQNQNGLGNGPKLLFVSRIKPRNHLEILIRVLNSLQQTHPNAQAIIIGGDNSELKRIRALSEERGLGRSVIYPGAIYDEIELAPWFLSADVFLYPSQVGLSMFHAFGYGLPVVAGVDPVLRNPEIEALTDGINGLPFPDGDWNQAVVNVTKLFTDKNLWNQLSSGAIHTVEQRYTIDAMVDGFAEGIRHAAEQKGNK